MSFGLPHEEGADRLSYAGYLRIKELTSLQQLHSDPGQHDETLFIIIHQVYELWFKQLLHEIDAVIQRLENDEPLSAHRLLRRCIEIQRVLVSQISVLETMTPMDFLAFRDALMPASGFQSAQFRELEAVSGLKDPGYLVHYQHDAEAHARIAARLAQPTLLDALYNMLSRRGFNVNSETDTGQGEDPPVRIRELKRIYEEADRHYDLFLLLESLIEYDESFALWRLHHIKMVERMIGSKTGTGGSEGVVYLRKTVDRRFFPDLWELRSYLSPKTIRY